MLVLGLAAVVGSRLVARRLAARLSTPLEVLAADAARLGDGDFTVSEPLPAGRRDPVPEIAAVHHSLAVTATRLDALLTRDARSPRRPRTSSAPRSQVYGCASRRRRACRRDRRWSPTPSTGPSTRPTASTAPWRSCCAWAREPAGTRREELAVDDLVARVVAEVRADGVPDGRTIAASAEDAGLRALASEAAVREILAVLVENALVHGAGRVTLTVRDAGSAVAVDVADEGTLAVEEGDAVHEPGRGLRRPRHRSGAGAPARRGPGRPAAAALAVAHDRDAPAPAGPTSRPPSAGVTTGRA